MIRIYLPLNVVAWIRQRQIVELPMLAYLEADEATEQLDWRRAQ